MVRFKTHYDNLNVSDNAPISVIKAAYKALCQKYHPDKYPGGPEEALRLMKTINAAYAVLSDPGKRAEHDHWIEKQKRLHASHEAHRILQIVAKNYNPQPVPVSKSSPFADYAVPFKKLWQSVCASYTKCRLIPVRILKNNKGFWLAAVGSLVLAVIIVLSPGFKTTPVESASQEVAAILKKAESFVKRGQTTKALPLYLKLAGDGNADAQFKLGLIYANGQGVDKDDKQAVDWFEKAAQQGHREAQTKLGFMYATGKGVTQNDSSAVYWCYKAAEQGDAIAQYNLGQMYAKGQGVAKDSNLAFSWFSKAAAQGDAHAQYSLGEMYANGTGVPKDSKQAYELYRKAAKQGLSEAIAALKKTE
jgi:hypothetical protein